MKTFKATYSLFLIIFSLSFITSINANENNLNDYYKTIRCLVCDGQSIQESDTEFAINLKEQIKKKYQNGISLNDINSELIVIYGERISFNPSNSHLLLWISPLILIFIIFLFVRKKIKFRQS